MRRTTWGSGLFAAVLLVAGACGTPLRPSSENGGGKLPDGGAAPSSSGSGASSGGSQSADAGGGPSTGVDPENGLDAGPLPEDAACGDSSCAYAPIGLPIPVAGVYTDNGPAAPTAGFRSLVAFPIRNQAQLDATVAAIYTVGGPQYRKYITPADWASTYAPAPADVNVVTSWLQAQGMTIAFTATNGLLVDFTGTVAQFNAAFRVTLHTFTRVNPETGNAPVTVYGVTAPAIAPVAIASRISSITSCDPPAEVNTLAPEGPIATTPPSDESQGLIPLQVAHAYEVDALASAGSNGAGATLAVVVGGTYGQPDSQSFWQSFGIMRADPTNIQTMEPPAHRISETTVDVEWSGAMAPGATLLAYEGPDALDTSLIFTFNEAVGRGVANVINDSFSHREDSEASEVRAFYDEAAEEAAALGITVIASCGDEGYPDIPGASPFVTCVGGTSLVTDTSGNVTSEVAWSTSGSGPTNFPVPAWQSSVAGSSKNRMACDLAANGGEPYWWFFVGQWTLAEGTSFSSPVVAGLLADVTAARITAGKPAPGYLNSILYTSAAAQQGFRDITSGGTSNYQAGPGWDPPTGWGAPNAASLATALP